MSTTPRVIAFYLPQFHPTPENDAWWGEGFTEWRNVVQARPLFPGHYQPKLPGALGFYDLRLPEVRQAQADMASAYGISAFCYYHYWFNGRQPLSRPFDEVLQSGSPDFPFVLCWANENWTRAWDGRSGVVLLEQHYSADDDRAHARWLVRAFSDERYLRVDGKAVFLIYRASLLPDPKSTVDIVREEAERAGVGEVLVCRVESFPEERGDPSAIGFDAAVDFQPDWDIIGSSLRRRRPWEWARRLRLSNTAYADHLVYRYRDVVDRVLAREPVPYRRFGCVTPRWDNTARRRDGGGVFHDSSPAEYERWLRHVLDTAAGAGDPLVFVNAWNEWAEGAYLEPDLRTGRSYLEATRRAVTGS
jgi:lipopolysaccharide biosynthesis protein